MSLANSLKATPEGEKKIIVWVHGFFGFYSFLTLDSFSDPNVIFYLSAFIISYLLKICTLHNYEQMTCVHFKTSVYSYVTEISCKQ